MQPVYVDPSHNAIADLVAYQDGRFITRINVPPPHRGQGIASKLLKAITTDADAAGAVLYIAASASGGLDEKTLSDWYRRHGFEGDQRQLMRRAPRTERNR